MGNYNYCFVTTLFGARYNGMLLTLLYSIKKNVPDADCFVFHQDNEGLFQDVKDAFPETTFVRTNFSFSDDKVLRISSKTLMWSDAVSWLLKNKGPQYDFTVLLDVDTLVLKDPFPELEGLDVLDADVLITLKENEKWPINTGVVIARVSNKTAEFFSAWKARTFDLFQDAVALKQASSVDAPYGGVDQMSMYQLIGYAAGEKNFNDAHGLGLRIKGIPCMSFNETNSRPITERTCIIHFKGGWQPILLDGKNFTKNRSKRECWPMYTQYLDAYKRAIGYLASKTGRPWDSKECGIYVPHYYDKESFHHQLAYALHCVKNYGANAIARLKRARNKVVRSCRQCT